SDPFHVLPFRRSCFFRSLFGRHQRYWCLVRPELGPAARKGFQTWSSSIPLRFSVRSRSLLQKVGRRSLRERNLSAQQKLRQSNRGSGEGQPQLPRCHVGPLAELSASLSQRRGIQLDSKLQWCHLPRHRRKDKD